MSKKTALVWMLAIGMILVACRQAEPEVDTQATAVAAGVSATLTAQAPPPTVLVVVTPPPPTPEPTPPSPTAGATALPPALEPVTGAAAAKIGLGRVKNPFYVLDHVGRWRVSFDGHIRVVDVTAIGRAVIEAAFGNGKADRVQKLTVQNLDPDSVSPFGRQMLLDETDVIDAQVDDSGIQGRAKLLRCTGLQDASSALLELDQSNTISHFYQEQNLHSNTLREHDPLAQHKR